MINNGIFNNNKETFRSVLILFFIIIVTFIVGAKWQGKNNQINALSVQLTEAKENPVVKTVEIEHQTNPDNYIDVISYIAKRFEPYGKTAVAEAITISYLESKWTASATNNNTNGTQDRGYWQINSGAHPQITEACARNLECSTDYAIKLYENKHNFNAWVASKVTNLFW